MRYELLIPTKFNGGKLDGFEKLTTVADPKRPGMFKTSVSHSTDGYKRNYSYAYGKCNQGEIQELIAKSTEIA
jgi:hypothetical protein